ncbi:hypothetical protein [Streptosporangium subroseum]|uniref:hypothetical protein n=1 Tax=Streptosporangium subroseum TaxID=106412 RepID=UPI003088C832|nr:hypothetical protein OHB15_44205 [Streptosporangium subroseum]
MLSLAIGLFLLVALFAVPVWENDAKLAAMIDRFESSPLPPKSDWLEYGSPDASVELRGNGNHCDYRARFMLRTQLTGRELTDYYDRLDIAGVEGTPPSITVWMPEPSKRSAYYSEGFGSHRAIVELSDSTDNGWDLRCT